MTKAAARAVPVPVVPPVDGSTRRVPVILRGVHGWDQADLARRGGVHPSALSKHERGKVLLPEEELEKLASGAGLTVAFAEQVIASAAVLVSSSGGSAGGDRVAEVACRLAALLAPAFLALESRPTLPSWVPDPEDPDGVLLAAAQWQRLSKRTPRQRLLVIEFGCEYQTEALLVRLCDESADAAGHSAADALNLAELAQRVAALASGSKGRGARREGYAWAFVANAKRVANLFPDAEAALARARTMFSQAPREEDELIDEARVLDLEASLLRDQGRMADALTRLDRALAICRPEHRARIQINQATTFEGNGDLARAAEALREALPAIERGEGGEYLGWLLRCSLTKILIPLGRVEEAAEALPDLWRDGRRLGTALDLLRLRRLGATVAAAQGRTAEALTDLAAVRKELAALPSPADAAIAGLIEAEILLREDRTGKVRTLVRAMGPTFESLGLAREAHAAYRRFVAAVEGETATVAMARELAKAIERGGRLAS